MARPVTKHLDRQLGFFSVFAISLGAMLGSGIFVLPLIAATEAGPLVALSYVLAGIIVLPALLSKAELATAMPIAGGTYVYVDRSMGPLAGTMAGIGTWFSLSAKTAFALIGLGAYVAVFSDMDVLPITVIVLAGLIALNVVGTTKASMLQKITVVGAVAALAVFVVSGSISIDVARFENPLPKGYMGIVATAGLVFVSYAGVTKICSVAEEIRNPEKNIPRGMIAAHLTAMLIYVAVSIVLAGNLDIDYYAALKETSEQALLTPVATIAETFWGPTGMVFMAIVAIVGLISMSNAGIMATSRYPFAMARDGLMPSALQKVHPRFGTPMLGILLTGALLFALVLFLPVEHLAHLASGFKLMIFCVVNGSVIALRETGVAWYRPRFKSPLYPWMQLLGIFGGAGLIIANGTFALVGCIIGLAAGAVWYFAFARQRVDRQGTLAHLWGENRVLEQTEVVEAAEESDSAESRVIVPLFGRETAPERLMELAGAFVDDGHMEVVSFTEVVNQTALGDMLKTSATEVGLADRAIKTAERLHLEVEFHEEVTHNAKQALLFHAEKTRADWIVAEWQQRISLSYWIRHPRAWWMDQPPCDLALFLDNGAADFSRLLVLARPGPYDTLLLHVANRIARQHGGKITLLYIADPGEDRASIDSYHAQLSRVSEDEPETLVVTSRDLGDTISKVTAGYDLLIIGAPSERGWRRILGGSRVHTISDRAKCSVLRLKAPRHKVHAFSIAEGLEEAEFVHLVRSASIVVGLSAGRKTELFAKVGEHVADTTGLDARDVTDAAKDREQTQGTALPGGFQVSGPILDSAQGLILGVFTLDAPIPFGGADKVDVDVSLFVFAPKREREKQLWFLARLMTLAREGNLLTRLRDAADPTEIRGAFIDASSAFGVPELGEPAEPGGD